MEYVILTYPSIVSSSAKNIQLTPGRFRALLTASFKMAMVLAQCPDFVFGTPTFTEGSSGSEGENIITLGQFWQGPTIILAL